MSIHNLDELIGLEEPKVQNHWLAPQYQAHDGFRICLSGASGSGKTNVAISMLLDKIRYDKLHIFTRTPTQPKYVYLTKFINTIEKKHEKKTGYKPDILHFYSEYDDFPDLDTNNLNKEHINVVLIDDFINTKDKSIEKYLTDMFIKGRHHGIYLMFLTQDLYKCDVTIRRQCNIFMLFDYCSGKQLDIIADEFSFDKDRTTFKRMFEEATDGHNFMMIDRQTNIKLLKHRKNLDQVWSDDKWTNIEELMNDLQ